MDESELAQRAVRGDREAFGELVRCHQAGVFNVAYRLLGERREAEDAAQEAFLRALRAIGRLDPSRPAGPWLKKIAVNVCLNRLEHSGASDLGDEAAVAAPDPGPESRVIAREGERELRLALLNPGSKVGRYQDPQAGLSSVDSFDHLGGARDAAGDVEVTRVNKCA